MKTDLIPNPSALWLHMHDTHGLTLLSSEEIDIRNAANTTAERQNAMLREELQAVHEVLSIIADNLTNDDGADPEAWWLELTTEQAHLIRAVVAKHRSGTPLVQAVKSDEAWPPIGFIEVKRCKHGTPEGYLCRDCESSPNTDSATPSRITALRHSGLDGNPNEHP